MASTVIDLVSESSEDENEHDAEKVDTRIGDLLPGQGGKRKIDDKKEASRKNPCPWNGRSVAKRIFGKQSYAKRVSPLPNERECCEVTVLENATKTAVAPKANDSTEENLTVASVLAKNSKEDSSPEVASATSSSLQAVPRVWMESDDNAIVTYDVLSRLRGLRGKKDMLLTTTTTMPHIQQTDMWSCGFRNIQMLLAALVPLLPASHPYFQRLAYIYCQEIPPEQLVDSMMILPSLRQLQQQLEASWNEGFDPKGALHFNSRVVGKASKIGAVEVGFVMSYWSIESFVVQFIKCHQSRRLLSPFVYRYFQGSESSDRLDNNNDNTAEAVARDCLAWAESGKCADGSTSGGGAPVPLYLQWEGHSVTVVGIEPPTTSRKNNNNNNKLGGNDWSQWNLLIFCPIKNHRRAKTAIAPFRMSCAKLLQKDCQLVLAGPVPLSPNQRLGRKDTAVAATAAKHAVSEVLAAN